MDSKVWPVKLDVAKMPVAYVVKMDGLAEETFTRAYVFTVYDTYTGRQVLCGYSDSRERVPELAVGAVDGELQKLNERIEGLKIIKQQLLEDYEGKCSTKGNPKHSLG